LLGYLPKVGLDGVFFIWLVATQRDERRRSERTRAGHELKSLFDQSPCICG
jgi:hypothetical protein